MISGRRNGLLTEQAAVACTMRGGAGRLTVVGRLRRNDGLGTPLPRIYARRRVAEERRIRTCDYASQADSALHPEFDHRAKPDCLELFVSKNLYLLSRVV